jgi:hypothetical protein
MIRLLIALAVLPLCAFAQSPMGVVGDNNLYEERHGVEWKEGSTASLPPYPDDSSLLKYSTNQTGMTYLVDKKSIDPGRKNIVRLTIVARSPSNARTVFYEGYHCGTKRYKRYAVAGSKGPLMLLDNPQWQVIIDTPDERFRKELLDLILCTQLYTAAPTNIIIDRLKYQTYRDDSYDD